MDKCARLLALFAVLAATLSVAGTVDRQDAETPPVSETFAFLIGNWQAEVHLPTADGNGVTQTATWTASYILDDRAILEEYKATDSNGEVVVLGINLRSYHAEKRRWIMYWFDALSGEVAELGPPDLGGVTVSNQSISFQFRLGDRLSRARFEDISQDHFTWHGDVSDDNGKTWQMDTIVVDAHRVVP